jgi:hypothetical protein
MPKSQRIIWTLIPRGIDTTQTPHRLRFSLVVSPRLEDTNPAMKQLADYPDWVNWPTTRNAIRFGIRFSNGTVVPWDQLTVLSTPSSQDWNAVFPLQTPVKPYQFPVIAQLPIASYPVNQIVELTETLLGTVATTALTDIPFLPRSRQGSVEGSVMTSIENLLGQLAPFTFDSEGRDQGSWKKLRRSQLLERKAIQFSEQTSKRDAVEWAKYFHEPMAAPNPPEPNPTFEKAYSPYKRVALTKPKPDFHEALSMLLDHPALLQQLGILLILELPLPPGIPSSGWVQVENLQWMPALSPTQNVRPQTLYILDTSGSVFLPQPTSGSELTDRGVLNVAAPWYGLTTLDPDSSLHKLVSYTHTISRVVSGVKAPYQANKILSGQARATMESRDLSTPAPRSVGIMLYRSNLGYRLRQDLDRATAINTQAINNTTPQLTYDDVLRGYRVDVWDSQTKEWHSLCFRSSEYQLLRSMRTFTIPSEEGTLTLSTAARADADPDELRIHEGFAIWKGWSLTVPRPGRTIDTDNEDNPVDPPNDPLEDYQVRVTFRPVAGTLPRLRFGVRYRMRLRATDLAGYSRSIEEFDAKDFSHSTEEIIYRRWEPVPNPVLLFRTIPDSTLQRGEQLETMAIRCYNDTDDSTPTTQTSERHVAAPRGSVELSEHHGKLDTATGGKLNPATYSMLTQREDTRPGGSANFPTAPWINPTTKEKIELPVFSGTQIITPYLPDPLARATVLQNVPGVPNGTAVWFKPDGSRVTVNVPIQRGCVLVNFGDANQWPDVPGFRLILAEGTGAPQWDQSERTLTIFLPKGEERILFYNTAIGTDPAEAKNALDLLAVYDLLKSKNIPNLKEAATAGLCWILTPWRQLTLVHAVQRPLKQPHISKAAQTPQRTLGDTNAELQMNLDFDGKSTGKLAISAEWSQPVDNPADEFPHDGLDGRPAAPIGKANIGERIIDDPTINSLTEYELNHEFGDTRYRRVRYRATAVSRYREFFDAAMDEDSFIRISDGVELDILNSARPASIEVLYAIPAFRWSRTTNGSTITSDRQPLTRIYFERPWYSSGEGELVGVLLPTKTIVDKTSSKTGTFGSLKALILGPSSLPEALKPYVTQWGLDPIWLSAAVPSDIAPQPMHFSDVVISQADLTLAELALTAHKVEAVGFAPRFDAERRLWYVDIQLDPGASYFPFVRFALARFQPKSIPDAHLSRVTQLDFIQILPRRTARVFREGNLLRIIVEGHTYRAGATVHASSEMEAVLEARTVESSDPSIGWEPVWASSLSRQESRSPGFWVGQVSLADLPASIAGKKLRVVLKEFEQWIGDAPLTKEQENVTFAAGTGLDLLGSLFTRRLVYADAIEF